MGNKKRPRPPQDHAGAPPSKKSLHATKHQQDHHGGKQMKTKEPSFVKLTAPEKVPGSSLSSQVAALSAPSSSISSTSRHQKKNKKKRNNNKERQAPTTGHSKTPMHHDLNHSASRPQHSPSPNPPTSVPPPKTKPLSALQEKFRRKLEGGKFRMLNEVLYTSTGDAALETFSKDPKLFDVYHQGFREQVSKWPRNPLDDIIAWVKKRPQARVADFGCGDARLAASVNNKVYSFDLVAKNKRVTACDIAHVPLAAGSVDIVVFCLSLMGVNMMDFIKEAIRVLTPDGTIKVAEVRSRFEGVEGGVNSFVNSLQALGLKCHHMDKTNKMFIMMEFKKSKGKNQGGNDSGRSSSSGGGKKGTDGPGFIPKACLYKKR